MSKWKTISAVASSLCLILLVALLVQQKSADAASAKAPAFSALDYIEIQQLQNKYGIDIDTCTNNGYDYADLYTPDGVFIDKYSEEGFQKGGLQRAKGRDELAAASWGGKLGCKNMPWNGWSHLMVNSVITPTAEGATGRVYLVMLGEKGPGSIARDGGYEDVYVKTAAGWRIKSRTHVRSKAWSNPLLRTPDLK
ncbi:MAG TPA: nuclear transport factor 2 family protein [Bryobacteraceae bacterium]|nr:nuclear transport factor 2 family protein [Bryobacteraceae bacterium]